YTDEALRCCVTLSQRYIQDRFLPDKAIDLMDEAGSKVNLLSEGKDKSEVQKKLQEIRQQKEIATKEERYEDAAKLRDQELRLEKQLDNHEAEKGIVDEQFIMSLIEE